MKLKSKIKKLIAFMLALCITLSTGITVFADETNSGAQQRIANFISLAAGKTVTDLSSDAMNMTQDELRFLGTYISNFFIPFGTELGTSDEDTTKQNQEDITKALKTNLHFSDAMAETFTETLMGLSRGNTQELEFRVSEKYHSGYVDVTSDVIKKGAKSSFKLNYYNFLRLMLGESLAVFEGYKDTDADTEVMRDIRDGNKYQYGYFGYQKDGKFVPMFDCSLHMKYMTPSMYAFYQCLGSVDLSRGYGFNFFDFTKDEASDEDTLKAMLEDLDAKEIYSMSAYGSTVRVDCFGNIIIKGGNHQYVAVPGCMNPYSWVTVKEDGSDGYQAGTAYNICSFTGLGMSDTDALLASTPNTTKETKVKDMKWASIQDTKLKEQLDSVEELYGHGLTNFAIRETEGYGMRMLRGKSDYKIGTFFGVNDTSYQKVVIKAQEGFKSANPEDYSYYASCYNGSDEHWYSLTAVVADRIALWGKYSTSGSRKEVRMLDKMVFIDNLGQFGFDSADKDIDFSAINFAHYLDDNGKSPVQLFDKWGTDAKNGFTNMYKDIQSGKMNTDINVDDAAIVSVYTTYAIAGLYKDDAASKEATIGKLGFRLNKEGLVDIENDPVRISEGARSDLILTSIRDWLYYLLHPTDGLNYVRELVTNKVNAFLLGWHNDMLGTYGVGATTGTTLYRSNTGYVTTPDLSEIEWTNSLISFYNEAIPFLIVLMIITMLFAYVTGILSLQRSIFGVVIFAVFLLMPVNLINGVVSVGNRVSQNIYGEKFTYWALVQQETYIDAIDKSANQSSYENYLKTLYASNSEVYSNQGSESIVLKWQAPKKLASLMLSKEDQNLLSSLSSTKTLKFGLNNNSFSGESFIDGDNVYLYRSYLDISNFSRYIYKGLKEGTRPIKSNLTNDIISNSTEDLQEAIHNMSTNYELDRNKGYTNKNNDGSSTLSDQLRVTVPMSSGIYNDAIGKKGTVKEMNIDNFIGINQDVFNFSLPMFNKQYKNGEGMGSYKEAILANIDDENRKTAVSNFLSRYSEEDISGLAAYSLMSENVFYYYSWGLYDSALSTGSTAKGGYKNLLLGKDNAGYFYNVDGNGELRDFMDMKSLFTYTIPYLKQGNDLVREWDDVYGTFVYEGVPTEEGHWDDPDIANNEELKQKYWHNLNVERLYGIYCPWVDLMYDCSYGKSETIKALGQKYVVENPIDPASYPENRPMVFSESEMVDYGLSRGDLTKVERLILDCNKGMEERMYELLNYYNFTDATLNTAAAMNCAFEFNNTFSENGVFSNNINLYPQSFELGDFSYDAFLRFILSNTTGESMTSQDDFYANIVQKSSMTSVLVMLILDVLSVYILPAFKIFFIIAVFLLSILIIVTTAFRVDPEQKFIKTVLTGVVVPMLQFLAITIGFSYVIALFMGTGNNAVTQTKHISIQMGDPVVVMFAMIAINIIALILYFKVLKGVVTRIKHHAKNSLNFMGGVFGGVAAMVSGAVMSGVGGSKGTSGGSAGGYGNVSEDGTGTSSPRAQKRGNGSPEDADDRNNPEESTRRNDSKRETFKQDKNEGMNSEESQERKESINKKTSSGMDKISNEVENHSTRERTRKSNNSVKDVGDNRRNRKE